MKHRLARFVKAPWYPFLFAVYPVLALLAFNISEVRRTAGLRPLLLSLAAALVLFLLLWPVYRQAHRAAFAVTLLLVLFYSYGHVYNMLKEWWEIPHLNAWMLGTWAVLAVLSLVWASWRRIRFAKAAPVLNLVTLGLVVYAAYQVLAWSVPQGTDGPVVDYPPLQTLHIPVGQTPPDIYYIVIDSYGRSDLLAHSFEIDNRDFIRRLEELGFYVADCSQSNYNRTEVSFGSSFNMQYLQALDDDFQPGKSGRRKLWDAIVHSTVRAELEGVGYRTVAFSTGFVWGDIRDADVYLTPSPMWSEMTEFETMLIRTTPARHLEDLGVINLDRIDGERYRQRTDLIFASMHDLARMPGPKFVFIHIIPPHPPFIYGPDGEPTDPASFLNEDRRYTYKAYTLGYQNQVAYITGQLEIAIETLLSESPTPPVIILQGDHAPWLQSGSGKFMILNGYYLPGHADLLYPSISPVNTFRLVLNAYLGADYALLPDVSYYSPVPNMYDFEIVPNPCLQK